MKAVILKAAGGPEQFELTTLPTPVIAADEVLINVKAISLNPVDSKTRSGKAMFKTISATGEPMVLGWDVSGVVEKVGELVTNFEKGDEVFGMIRFPGHGKAYAAMVAAPAAHLTKKPSSISHEEAAAATLAALTAWQALITNANISKGQRVLIQAAAGGVGHYAVQIAKHAGAYVIGTSSAANRAFVLSLGADEHIDYHQHAITDVVRDLDFVLDPVGGSNIEPSLSVVKKSGTVITLPSQFAEEMANKAKELGVNGYFFMVHSSGSDLEKLADLLAKGVIRSHVSATFSLDQIQEAHRQLDTGRTRGKIIVIP